MKGMSAIVRDCWYPFLCVWICAGHWGAVSEYLPAGVLDGTAEVILGMI